MVTEALPHPPTHGLSLVEVGALTRERLLDTAERLFAERGFAATSVRDITAAAGCNLAAVNYHFGGKSNLYREAFLRGLIVLREQRLAALREIMARRPAPEVAEVLHVFATAFVAPLHESRGPLLFQLWTRELLDPRLPPETFAAEMIMPIRRALLGALRSLEPTLTERDAVLCIQSFVAQLSNVFHLQRFAQSATIGPGAVTPAEHVRHIVAFSVAGIRAAAAASRGGPRSAHKEVS
jgi:AcrR family transcriptional regulator